MDLRKSATILWKMMRSMFLLTGAGFWIVILAIQIKPHFLSCSDCTYIYHSHYSGRSWDPAHVQGKIAEQQKAGRILSKIDVDMTFLP